MNPDLKLSFLFISHCSSVCRLILLRLDLSSLSIFSFQSTFAGSLLLVGSNGIEPSTSRLSGARSNQLSYEPIFGYFRFFPLCHLLTVAKWWR